MRTRTARQLGTALLLYPQFLLAAAALEVALRRSPVRRVVAWARRIGQLPLPLGRRLVDDQRLERMAARAVNLAHGPDGCLPRAVLLAALGHDAARGAAVVLGVRLNEDAALAGHAWLEAGGETIGDTSAHAAAYQAVGRL